MRVPSAPEVARLLHGCVITIAPAEGTLAFKISNEVVINKLNSDFLGMNTTNCPNRRPYANEKILVGETEAAGRKAKSFKTKLFEALETMHDVVDQFAQILSGKQSEMLIFALQSVLLGNSKGVENFLKALFYQGDQADLMLGIFCDSLEALDIETVVSYPPGVPTTDAERYSNFSVELRGYSNSDCIDDTNLVSENEQLLRKKMSIAFQVSSEKTERQQTQQERDYVLESFAMAKF